MIGYYTKCLFYSKKYSFTNYNKVLNKNMLIIIIIDKKRIIFI